MLLPDGFDIAEQISPVFIMVVMFIVLALCFFGLATWLFIIVNRNRNKSRLQSVLSQPPRVQNTAPPYILAIRRSGSEWEIYVNGQRTNAMMAPYDGVTRKEAIAALRELVSFARDKLQMGAAPAQAVSELAVQTLPTLPDAPASVLQAAPGASISGVVSLRPRPIVPTDSAAKPRSLMGMDLAREIGEIVDEIIAASPSLQSHAVTLMNAQTKGINFVVDGAVYNAVEEIPNPEIQELIRKATREWERR